MKRIILAAMTVLIAACGSLSNLSDEETKALKEAMATGNFTVAVNNVDAMRFPGLSSSFSDVYRIQFKQGEVNGTLPYFGEIHGMAPMSPDQAGITFDHTKVNYKIKNNSKKDCYEIDFTAKLSSGEWRAQVTIYNNGTVDIRMSNPDRDPISYRGSLDM